uniref:Acetyl-coenzyme A carboxylase carboxyl transferase subunit beta n=1 Tax=Pterospora andromedea TaxID=4349 RepID=A0A221SRB7_PTEAN|nr:acetyl-CoA carboxylase carboxyltransferase beta subunit [Pterospora andromedea]
MHNFLKKVIRLLSLLLEKFNLGEIDRDREIGHNLKEIIPLLSRMRKKLSLYRDNAILRENEIDPEELHYDLKKLLKILEELDLEKVKRDYSMKKINRLLSRLLEKFNSEQINLEALNHSLNEIIPLLSRLLKEISLRRENEIDPEKEINIDPKKKISLEIDPENESDNNRTHKEIDPENESDNNRPRPRNYKHLWVQCETCFGLNYKSFFMSKLYICEWCDSYVQMDSSDRIDFLVDKSTWIPMDEDMVSLDTIEWDIEEGEPFDWAKWEADLYEEIEAINDAANERIKEEKERLDSEEAEKNKTDEERLDSEEAEKNKTDEKRLDSEETEKNKTDEKLLDYEEEAEENKTDEEHLDSEETEKDKAGEKRLDSEEEAEEDKTYEERLDYYQSETGLNEAVQTGIAELNGIPVALGVMDFKFIAGTMGSVVGEKITRLIEYAIIEFLPLIIVCTSGGARMQEGSLSLMQMSKIACALYTYKLDKKLFYISILTSPTTGGVTASFAMLGNVIISEPEAVIAFAGKRVIEETLNIKVTEGVQETEYLFSMGAFDLILPRTYYKSILSLLYLFHSYRLAFV